MLKIVFLLILFPAFAEIPYVVKYEGIQNKELIETLKTFSQLEALKDHPPTNITALNRRIEADLPNFHQGMQTAAFYHPTIDCTLQTKESPAVVTIQVTPGPIFWLKSYEITPTMDLGIRLGEPALPAKILEIEQKALAQLLLEGHYLAHMTKREVIADLADHSIRVILEIDPGPEVLYGVTTIKGLSSVNPLFVCRKIAWYEGLPFNPEYLEQTQSAIEDTRLFASVTITCGEELDETGHLPIAIDLVEGKHRTVGLGASYNTQLGPGMTAEWELRNMRGLGEQMGFRVDAWGRLQRGSVIYTQPDFHVLDQNILWLGEFEHEITDGFEEMFYSVMSLVERQISEQTNISYGLQFKELDSTNSNNNGTFGLIKAPLFVRWNSTNNLLDPTTGQSLYLKLTPTWSILKQNFLYYTETAIFSLYKSLDQNEKWIFAGKVNIGSIFGASNREIPPPERFYSGNEHTLRGYKYMTVSPIEYLFDPLTDEYTAKPIGGRSMMVYSLELRHRIGEKFGWVAFWEIGNVYAEIMPNFQAKQLQSAGVGLRYHTPVGPLRADLAVPFNRRPDGNGGYIDRPYELYFSIGQAF